MVWAESNQTQNDSNNLSSKSNRQKSMELILG